jgi:hypothetical protein
LKLLIIKVILKFLSYVSAKSKELSGPGLLSLAFNVSVFKGVEAIIKIDYGVFESAVGHVSHLFSI